MGYVKWKKVKLKYRSEVEIKHLFRMHSHVMQQTHSCSLLVNSINESYQRLVSAFIVIQMNNSLMVTFDNLFLLYFSDSLGFSDRFT